MCQRSAVQAAACSDTSAAEFFAKLLAINRFMPKRQHARLSSYSAGEDLKQGDAAEMFGRFMAQTRLVAADILLTFTQHILDPLAQSGYTDDIVRSCLGSVREILRHILYKALRARTSAHKRFGQSITQENTGSLRSEQALMPRHCDKCSIETGTIELFYSCRLRRINNKRHTASTAYLGYFIHRLHEPENI